MITRLFIQNYAIIDELSISFEGGLNIITGETGAGKSILMGALNLILGQRADSSVLQDAQKKCIIEGVFQIHPTTAIKQFFQQNELDMDTEIVIRREIAANGKSRSFVNDTPVNLSQIKQLSIHLVDLHQQFDTLEINSADFQFEVLDALADNQQQLIKLREHFEQYAELKKLLSALKQEQASANKELDYHQFLFNEIHELSLKENELEDIEVELKIQNNAESIKHSLSGIFNELSESEQPITNQLKSILNKLKTLHQYHPNLANISNRLQSAVIEIQDISDDLIRIENGIHYDAEKLQLMNDRLSAGYKLLKKHGLTTTTQLIALMEQLQKKLDKHTNISTSIATTEKETALSYDACIQIANIISKNRAAQIEGFTAQVNHLLIQVGMPNARMKIALSPATLSENGLDAIAFLFDANKSDKFEPVSKVASGGELSRLMLSIKSLVAKKLSLPTLIFDEIDTGISGEAAKQVGIIMKDLSASHQVIAITHQAQIAARASTHYFVYKNMQAEKVTTRISILNKEERIQAIAKMLSGEKPTAAAIANAKEMLEI